MRDEPKWWILDVDLHNFPLILILTSVSEYGMIFPDNSELTSFTASLFIPLLLYNTSYKMLLLF